MIINNIPLLDKQISDLEDRLKKLKNSKKDITDNIPELKLSAAYEDGFSYGIVYKTGHGDIETLELMSTCPENLISTMKDRINGFDDLYLVAFKPEKVVLHIAKKLK